MSVLVPIVVGMQLVATALLTGFMLIVQLSLVPAQHRLDAVAYTLLEQGMNRVLERLTPALMIAATAFGLVAVLLEVVTRRPSWPVLALGVAGLVTMIVTTLRINAPVNAAIDGWNPAAPPADWRERRDRWERGHAIRSWIGLGALLCCVAAAVWPS